MKPTLDINQAKVPEWDTPVARLTREIEHNTKLIGEVMVNDFKENHRQRDKGECPSFDQAQKNRNPNE